MIQQSSSNGAKDKQSSLSKKLKQKISKKSKNSKPKKKVISARREAIKNISDNTHFNKKHKIGTFSRIGDYLLDYQEKELQKSNKLKNELEESRRERRIQEAIKSAEGVDLQIPKTDGLGLKLQDLCSALNGLDLSSGNFDNLYQKFNN